MTKPNIARAFNLIVLYLLTLNLIWVREIAFIRSRIAKIGTIVIDYGIACVYVLQTFIWFLWHTSFFYKKISKIYLRIEWNSSNLSIITKNKPIIYKHIILNQLKITLSIFEISKVKPIISTNFMSSSRKMNASNKKNRRENDKCIVLKDMIPVPFLYRFIK